MIERVVGVLAIEVQWTLVGWRIGVRLDQVVKWKWSRD